jgi:hypothetical protein
MNQQEEEAIGCTAWVAMMTLAFIAGMAFRHFCWF